MARSDKAEKARQKEEKRESEAYDWIDDPFDEKKAEEERQRAGMSGSTKAFVGCGFAVVIVVLLLVVGLVALFAL